MRKEQLRAFREQALREFEDRAVMHVARCFPAKFGALGEDEVRHIIKLGVERAARYGIVGQRDVCKFIDMMLIFGPNFAEDRAWARGILANSHEDPVQAAFALHERAVSEA